MRLIVGNGENHHEWHEQHVSLQRNRKHTHKTKKEGPGEKLLSCAEAQKTNKARKKGAERYSAVLATNLFPRMDMTVFRPQLPRELPLG